MTKSQRPKPSLRRVLALWRKDPALKASLRDVRTAMGATKAQADKVKAILQALTADGALSYDKRYYRLARAPAVSIPPQPREAAPELVGRLSATLHGYGFVSTPGGREDLFVPARHMGGALDGNSVRVSLNQPKGGGRSHAIVETVLERGRETVRGTLRREYGELWVEPFNERLPMIFIEHDPELPHLAHVEVRITEYPQDQKQAPGGTVEQELPGLEDVSQLIENLIHDAGHPVEFTPETLAQMASVEPPPLHDLSKGREDQRETLFITIDGEDAQDFDDAVHLSAIAGGNFRLTVAIADVAEYVPRGSAVDQDAWLRGTSVYFPGRVLPMLPPRLSNELCSLRADEPRLALACEMELDSKGELVRYRIFESLIQSRARLSYTQVNAFLEGDASQIPTADIGEMLKQMAALAAIMAKRRLARGALALNLPEPQVELNAAGHPTAIHKRFPSTATRLIEQFMLEANETVAAHCEGLELPILYRVHDPPPDDQFQSLFDLLGRLGFSISVADLKDHQGLNRLLQQVAGHPREEQILVTILKAMSQARYRLGNEGHFGLAATHYCHFTSPIRRYPDLMVHRAVKAALGGATGGKGGQRASLGEAGLHLSTQERQAESLSNQVQRLFRVVYMEPFLGHDFVASVAGVNDRGVWLILRDEYAEGWLPLSALPDKRYRFDRTRQALTLRGGGLEIAVGVRLQVKLVRADRLARLLEFSFNDWGWPE